MKQNFLFLCFSTTALLCFCLFSSLLSAQTWPTDLYFSSIDQKIPRAFASAFEDSQGFLWFCTGGGICRYDGSEVRLYKADMVEMNTLSSSHTRDMTEDRQGKLWITTKRGLNSFDPVTGNFQTFFADERDSTTISGNWPEHLTTDEEGLLWIGFNEAAGLTRFNPVDGTSKRFPIRNGKLGCLQGSVVGKIVTDNGRIYLGTTAGFEYYDKATDRFHFIPLLDEQGDTVYYRLDALCKSRDGKIWMNMPDKGLRVYDPEKNTASVFQPAIEGKTISQISDLVEGKDGRLWLLNWPELRSVSPDRQMVQQHEIKFVDHNPDRGHEELYNDLYIDRYGMLWIGPHFLDPRRNLFSYYQVFGDQDQKPLFVTDLQEVNDSILIVYLRQGLLWYNLNDRTATPAPFPPPAPMGESDFSPGDPNWIWVKINGDIHFYNVTTKKLHKLALEKNGKPFHTIIMDTHFDQEENIWISTWGQGLVRIPKATWKNATGPIREFDQWLPDSPPPTVPTQNLLRLMVDSRNDVWVAASVGGLIRINANTGVFQQYDFKKGANTVSDTYIFEVVEGQDNTIWISTNTGGLNKYNAETDQFTVYNRRNGMLDEDLFNIDIDRDGHLWMNSDAGISSFNPLTETFTDYNEHDGVLAWRNNGIISKKTNRLIWGGRQGFTVAHLDRLKNRPTYPSDLALTSIRFFDPDSSALVGLQPIDWTDHTLDLSYRQNVLDIQFSMLDFRNPVKHQYRYALTHGGELEWIDLGRKNQVGLSQLVPGTYYLHLQGCNSDRIWTTSANPLKIIIHPPFWRTSWAYAGYLLLFFGGVYYVYHLSLRRQFAQQEARKVKEMDVLKTRLYTNITHEFRTPLTVIMGVSDELELNSEHLSVPSVEKQKIQQGHRLIQRNSKNLLRLVNQILDLAKLDSEAMDLDIIQADMVHFLRYLTESFHSMAAEKNIELTFDSEMEVLVMDFDEIKIQHIVYNLLSNAIKFTPKGGAIDFLVNQIEEQGDYSWLQIKVRDNGIGIGQEQLPFIFDRFYQTDTSTTRKGEGTGIGLALTKELVELMGGNIYVKSMRSKGTVFTVNLPVKRETESAIIEKIPLPAHHLGIDLIPEKSPGLSADSMFLKANDGQELPVLLIIEDNPDVVSYMESILQKEYHIEIANDGQAGIDKALEIVPDIIITDVMMPEKDGYEVCATLKTDERTSHIPIIMLTAKAAEADRLAGLETGADAYLTKPFNKAELFIRLAKLVALRQALQQRYAQAAGPLDTIGLSRNKDSKAPTLDDLFLEKIRRIIDEKIGDTDLDIAYLCQVVHLSSTQLFRKMKALTGEAPMSFIRKVRLHKAKELLQTTDLSISEIAYDLGFTDPHYFSRAFRKEFGHPPSFFNQ